MFRTMAGGEDPGPGRPGKTWIWCLVDDIAVVRAKEGSTETPPLLFGVETGLAAKQAGKRYRGIVKAADGFTARWHRAEEERRWRWHANEDVKKKGKKEKGGGRGGWGQGG